MSSTSTSLYICRVFSRTLFFFFSLLERIQTLHTHFKIVLASCAICASCRRFWAGPPNGFCRCRRVPNRSTIVPVLIAHAHIRCRPVATVLDFFRTFHAPVLFFAFLRTLFFSPIGSCRLSPSQHLADRRCDRLGSTDARMVPSCDTPVDSDGRLFVTPLVLAHGWSTTLQTDETREKTFLFTFAAGV